MKTTTTLTPQHQREIDGQVSRFLAKSQSFNRLPAAQQLEIRRHTTDVVRELAKGPRHSGDPYAAPLEGSGISSDARGANIDASGDTPGQGMQGNTEKLLKSKQGEMGDVIGAGVTQAARMVHEIDFPAFVASLIEGTFHSIVKSSIEQMQAYAEMVKSVSTSLNDFKDKNTTDNQARDHLVEKYPQHFKMTIVDGKPKIGLQENADDAALPNFQKDLGMSENVTSIDEDMIEEKLVPAARDDLARGRQQLLATVILMGINRIIITDGKINAKIKFQFSANEKRQLTASAYDYVKTGNVYTAEGTYDQGREGATYSSDKDGAWQGGGGSNYAKGEYKSSVKPDVRVTSQVDMSSDGAIQASGQIMGEVSVNFKSETFPLEKMVNTDQMMQLQSAQGGGTGRGAPAAPAGSPAAAAAPAPPAPVAQAPTPVVHS